MGRFQQIAAAPGQQFLDDKMFQSPTQLMGQVIDRVDKDIATNEDAMHSISALLEAKGLSKQEQARVDEIFSGYDGDIENLSKTLQENPLEFRRKGSEIKALATKLNTDFQRGELGEIKKRNEGFEKWDAYQKERLKLKQIDQDDYRQAKDKMLNRYNQKAKSYYEDGEQDAPLTLDDSFEDLVDYQDVVTLAETTAGNMKDVVLENSGLHYSEDGTRITTISGKKVEKKVIEDVVDTELRANEKLMSYYDQKKRLGLMSDKQIDEAIREQARAMAEKYGGVHEYTETERWDELALMNAKPQTVAKAKANTEKVKKGEETIPETVSNVSIPSVPTEDFNKDKLPVYSASLGQAIEEVDEVLANPELSDWEKTNALGERRRLMADKLNKDNIIRQANDYALTTMKKEGALTEQDEADLKEYNRNKRKIEADHSNKSWTSDKFRQSIAKNGSEQLKKEMANYDLYERIKSKSLDEKYSNYQDKWYEDNAKSNVQYSTVVNVSPTDETTVQLFDEIAMNSSSESKIILTSTNRFDEGGSKDNEATPSVNTDTFFEVGGEMNLSMSALASKTGKKPSELFDFEGFKPGIGGRLVASYRYSSKKFAETAELDGIDNFEEGQRFFVDMGDPGLNGHIAEKYGNSENYKVRGIAKAMTDPYYMKVSELINNNVMVDPNTGIYEFGVPVNIVGAGNYDLTITPKKAYGGNRFILEGNDPETGEKLEFPNQQDGFSSMETLTLAYYQKLWKDSQPPAEEEVPATPVRTRKNYKF